MYGRVFVCLWVIVTCCAALNQTQGWTGKLLVVPLDGSHWTGVKAVAEEMGRRGHTVIMVIPEISMRMGPGQHYITKQFPVPYSRESFDQMMREHSESVTASPGLFLVNAFSKLNQMKKVFEFVAATAESLFKNEELIDFLRKQNFDAVLTDPALPPGAILAYNLSVPAVYMMRGMPCSLDAAVTASPNPPSYVPRFFTRNTDRMSFIQRVGNMLVSLLEIPLCKMMYRPFEDITYNFIQRDVNIIEILRSASVWLMRFDFTLEFPKPMMPNMVLIGGINCEIRNPLTKVRDWRAL